MVSRRVHGVVTAGNRTQLNLARASLSGPRFSLCIKLVSSASCCLGCHHVKKTLDWTFPCPRGLFLRPETLSEHGFYTCPGGYRHPTDAHTVARWVLQHQQLPDYYLTKSDARKRGWNPAKGNLCEVLPGKAIGGDRFTNREKRLPSRAGRQWYEADVNYRCGHRDADRLVYSSDGLVFLSTDHYRSFRQVP